MHVEFGCFFVVVDEFGCADELPVVVLRLVEFVFEIKPVFGFTDKIISMFKWDPITQS